MTKDGVVEPMGVFNGHIQFELDSHRRNEEAYIEHVDMNLD